MLMVQKVVNSKAAARKNANAAKMEERVNSVKMNVFSWWVSLG